MQWMPIESAPRDGTEIIVFGRRLYDGTPVPIISKWVESVVGAHHWDGVFEPTHWMPLPEPPQSDA